MYISNVILWESSAAYAHIDCEERSPYCLSLTRFLFYLQALSTTKEKGVWIEQDFFIDPNHYEDVFAKMMQGESVALLLKEFFEVVIQ
jgi:hypothetical protein